MPAILGWEEPREDDTIGSGPETRDRVRTSLVLHIMGLELLVEKACFARRMRKLHLNRDPRGKRGEGQL